MRVNLRAMVISVLLSVQLLAQNGAPSGSDEAAIAALGQKAAIAALNFRQGDAAGLTRARADFTADGWKSFIKNMEGFLDPKGVPMFTSSFVAAHDATVLEVKDGVLHLKIPGTLTQSSRLGSTTYRAAIEVYVLRNQSPGGKRIQIQRLEQIACAGASTACQ